MLIQKKTGDCILIAGFVLLILCLFALFTGIAPTFIVPWTASKYRALMSDHNKYFRKNRRIIGIGSEVKFEQPGKRSLGGHYSTGSVSFVPSDSTLSRWKCKGKSSDWGGSLADDTKGFDIEIQILVPDDPKLEGRTVDGELRVHFVYPKKTKNGVFMGEFSNYGDSIIRPLSIHVFTAEEVRQLTKIWDKMESASGWLAVFFFFGGILLLSAYPKLERSKSYQEFAIQIAPLVVAITVCLCVNRLVVWAYGDDQNVLEFLGPPLSFFLVLFVAGKLRRMSAQRTKVEDKLAKERKKKVQCPECEGWDVRWATIEDGGMGHWCDNCKKSLKAMEVLRAKVEDKPAKQCPRCEGWDVRWATIEDGGMGHWCDNCKKSLKAMVATRPAEKGKVQCPECGSWDLRWAKIEDGGMGDWCDNCKKSVKAMVAARPVEKGKVQCPECGSLGLRWATIEDGGMGHWCDNCKKSLKAMGSA